MNRRGRHCLGGGCDGQSKCNSDQPDHCHLPYEPSKKDFLEEERAPSRRLHFQYTPFRAIPVRKVLKAPWYLAARIQKEAIETCDLSRCDITERDITDCDI
jgi:hypothetical protein